MKSKHFGLVMNVLNSRQVMLMNEGVNSETLLFNSSMLLARFHYI